MVEQKKCDIETGKELLIKEPDLKAIQEQNVQIQEVKWSYQDNNILSSGVDRLLDLKSHLSDLQLYKENVKQLEAEDDDLDHLIMMKEKAIAEETESVVRKRRAEVLSTFENQIDNTKADIKKVKAKRERRKNKKISERISEETTSVRNELQQNKEDLKQQFRMDGVPSLLNTRLLHVLYYPVSIFDAFLDTIMVILALFVIPNLLVRYVFQTDTLFYVTLVYFIDVVLFLILYCSLSSLIKNRYKETYVKAKSIREKIIKNHREIKKIKRAIIKDKDESNYGLEKYNKELSDLEQVMDSIVEKRKHAVEQFEATTKGIIAQEVYENNKQELQNLQKKHEEVHELNKSYANKVKELEMQLASTYEAYLGKTFMNLEKLEKLIKIMESHDGMVVSDAIKLFQEQLLNK